MVSSVLWISVATLAFLRLAETGSEYALLHEGEKCGEYDQGRCESGLICVPDNPEPELFNAVGVCTSEYNVYYYACTNTLLLPLVGV